MKRPARPPFKAKDRHPIDKGIAREVRVLWENGVETFESCQGGRGHPFTEPTVRFHGDQSEGLRALAVAIQNGLGVTTLRRYYNIICGEAIGPYWEMTFRPRKTA